MGSFFLFLLFVFIVLCIFHLLFISPQANIFASLFLNTGYSMWRINDSLLFTFVGVEGKVETKVLEQNKDDIITCADNPGQTIFWLRLKGSGQGFEYTGSYSMSKKEGKVNENLRDKFVVKEKTLEVKRFQRETDSGTYGCLYINNNELKFATMTELRGKPSELLHICIQLRRASDPNTIHSQSTVMAGYVRFQNTHWLNWWTIIIRFISKTLHLFIGRYQDFMTTLILCLFQSNTVHLPASEEYN